MFGARAQRPIAIVVALLLTSAGARAAGSSAASEVKSVVVAPGDGGPIIEIFSTRSLTPSMQVVESPMRLVIDLPNSTIATAKRKIPFRNEEIKGIRMDQYQASVVRIVVDLARPVLYTWDAMGHRLNIRLRTDEAAKAKPQTVPAFTAGVQPAAIPVAVGSSGTLVEAGNRVASGSSITAGEEIALLRLARGGEVRVCPGTTVSVTTSSNGQDLMLGMSKGAMETHYGLTESMDTVLTPDFRIVLPGPGQFDLAISADARGNTCVGSSPRSTSSAVIAELLGNGTYEIKPDQQVVFRQGRLDSVETAISPCGCPAAQEPVLRASTNAPVISEEKAGNKLTLENSDQGRSNSETPSTSAIEGNGDPKQNPQQSMRVDVESPLVFSGKDIANARRQASAALLSQAAALPLSTKPAEPLPAVVVLPPTADPPQAKKGFFGKIKGFFGSMFH